VLIVATVAAVALPASAHAKATLKPVATPPLSSKAAAMLVVRSGFEPRPGNQAENHAVPRKRKLLAWRKGNDMPYRRYVNGRFRGTTDEIIQWSAYKWGLDEDVLRAVAVVESWWRQETVSADGTSFGLFQVRRPYHCRARCAIAKRSTAFNADYYGGIIRAYYDGMMPWLNTVERGRPYAAGDLLGSVGAWFAGRWWTPPALGYVTYVQSRLFERTWERPYFIAG